MGPMGSQSSPFPCTPLLQTDNHASTPPLRFLQAGCPSCCPTNSVKALKAMHNQIILRWKLQHSKCCYFSFFREQWERPRRWTAILIEHNTECVPVCLMYAVDWGTQRSLQWQKWHHSSSQLLHWRCSWCLVNSWTKCCLVASWLSVIYIITCQCIMAINTVLSSPIVYTFAKLGLS